MRMMAILCQLDGQNTWERQFFDIVDNENALRGIFRVNSILESPKSLTHSALSNTVAAFCRDGIG